VIGDLSGEEFRALRDAVAQRGQLRVTLAVVGILAWSALLVAILIALPYPLAAIIPLMALVATFEAIRSLHAGAERIGRYLQVFYEEYAGDDVAGAVTLPAWEQTAMALGAAVPGAAGHPLFVPVFALAGIVNFLGVLLPGPIAVELWLLAIPHAAFLLWLVRADRAMRGQRTREQAAFRDLKQTARTRR
jgi:hypothetical protein